METEKNKSKENNHEEKSIKLNNDLFVNNENKKEVSNKKHLHSYIIHEPLKYGKKIYLSEVLAEQFIKLVAFVSIAIILAIFYYVFSEAQYAFFKEDKPKTEIKPAPFNNQNNIPAVSNNDSKNNLTADKPESYGDVSSDKPESYGEISSDKPESYGDVSSDKPESYGEISSDKPESYGDASSDKPESYGEASSDKPESYGDVPSDKPESYGDVPDMPVSTDNPINNEPPRKSVEHGHDQPITLKELFLPNDFIDGKAEYIWQPISEVPKYSIIPLAIGAFKVTLIGILIAAPIAILAAIFTTAFAPKWLKEIMKPAIEILAGFPSVVIGFFCLMTLASISQNIFGYDYRLNAFIGGLGMSLAVIPIIYTVAEDALSAIPKMYKEASLALGASRWQTAYKVILPAATPGVFAAIILGFGRAFGETMIALMATGNAALVDANIFHSVRTMSATIGAEMAEVEFHGVHYGVLFLIGSILFVFTFTLNAVAEFYVRNRLLKKFQGK